MSGNSFKVFAAGLKARFYHEFDSRSCCIPRSVFSAQRRRASGLRGGRRLRRRGRRVAAEMFAAVHLIHRGRVVHRVHRAASEEAQVVRYAREMRPILPHVRAALSVPFESERRAHVLTLSALHRRFRFLSRTNSLRRISASFGFGSKVSMCDGPPSIIRKMTFFAFAGKFGSCFRSAAGKFRVGASVPHVAETSGQNWAVRQARNHRPRLGGFDWFYFGIRSVACLGWELRQTVERTPLTPIPMGVVACMELEARQAFS